MIVDKGGFMGGGEEEASRGIYGKDFPQRVKEPEKAPPVVKTGGGGGQGKRADRENR